MELWYTARDVDDATLQHRLQGVLPWLKDVLGACEADYAARVAAQAAPAAPAPQAPPAPQPTSAPADLQTLVQQALAAQANGAAPSGPAPDDQQTGFWHAESYLTRQPLRTDTLGNRSARGIHTG